MTFFAPIYLAKGRPYCLLCQSPFTHIHLTTSQSKSIQLNQSKYPGCVSIVIVCRLDDQVFRIRLPTESKYVYSIYSSRTFSDCYPTYSSMSKGGLSARFTTHLHQQPRLKLLHLSLHFLHAPLWDYFTKRQADSLSLSIVKVKNVWR
jgi:hypothetical protein